MTRIVRVILLSLLLSGCIKQYVPDLTEKSIEGNLIPSVPFGWLWTGTSLENYGLFYDTKCIRSGTRSMSLLSVSALSTKFASLQQSIEARNYAGKRVRFTAFVRTNRVRGWSGIWLRADTPTRQAAAFDNMSDRKIEGSVEWRQYHIVLDIPDNSMYINYGILLHGTGQIWIDDCAFEIVGDSVQTTGTWRRGTDTKSSREPYCQDEPINLDFEIVTDQ